MQSSKIKIFYAHFNRMSKDESEIDAYNMGVNLRFISEMWTKKMFVHTKKKKKII